MKWTPEKEKQLAELYQSHTRREICEIMGLRDGQVRTKLWRMGLNHGANPWTQEETHLLVEVYARADYGEEIALEALAWRLGRHKSNVCRKARQLGLTNNKREQVRNKKLRQRKYKTQNELRAAQSERQKKQLRENGHPRGMLGKKHTDEVKAALSESTRRREALLSEDEKSRRTLAGMKTKDKNGTLIRNGRRGSWKAEWREIGGKRNYYRSLWEANYARYLEFLKKRGDIREWEHEPKTFWFDQIKRGVRSYIPDFLVTYNCGKQAYHEVKGWMDPRSKTKLKRMAKYYPDDEVVLIQADEYKAIKNQVKALIPDWELDTRGR